MHSIIAAAPTPLHSILITDLATGQSTVALLGPVTPDERPAASPKAELAAVGGVGVGAVWETHAINYTLWITHVRAG